MLPSPPLWVDRIQRLPSNAWYLPCLDYALTARHIVAPWIATSLGRYTITPRILGSGVSRRRAPCVTATPGESSVNTTHQVMRVAEEVTESGGAAVNTKRVERRDLRLRSLVELLLELARIGAAADSDALRVTGNWSTGQQCDHLAIFWEASMKGFPDTFRAPLPIRLIVQVIYKRRAASGEPPKPGLRLPKAGSWLLPRPDVTVEEGMARLKACVAATGEGKPFVPESPLFGKLTREQWINLHLGHCSHHLGYSWPG